MGPPVEAAGGLMGPPIEAAGLGAAEASPFSYATVGSEPSFGWLNASGAADAGLGQAAAVDGYGTFMGAPIDGGLGSMVAPPIESGFGATLNVPTYSNVGAGLAGTGGGFGASQLGQAINGFLEPVGGLKGLGEISNVAAPLIGGWMQNNAAKDALQAQISANNQANALLQRVWEPALAARDGALSKINGLLSNPQSVTNEPGYQFGLNQGVRAMDQSAASRGMRLSGQQAKALTQYGQDYAGTKLDQSLNRLLQVANVGNMGTGSLNQQAGNTVNIGDSAGAASIAGSNAWGNALNQLTAYGNKKNWWQS